MDGGVRDYEMDKQQRYDEVKGHIRALIEGECDEIAVMSTVVCELFGGFDYFDWVGFYRVVEPGVLKVGPYQGGHGCLVIPFERGVCGACATTRKTQIVADVTKVPYHIACSSSTRSEIVVPVLSGSGEVTAVLDIDSDEIGVFDEVDRANLEEICEWLT